MTYFMKRTLLVCLGIVCLYTSVPIETKANTSILASQLLAESDPIIITVIGFDILIESTEGDAIILAANLYDSTQQLILSERANAPTPSLTINGSGLPSGYYVLQVETIEGVESFQLYLS